MKSHVACKGVYWGVGTALGLQLAGPMVPLDGLFTRARQLAEGNASFFVKLGHSESTKRLHSVLGHQEEANILPRLRIDKSCLFIPLTGPSFTLEVLLYV